MQLTAKIKLKPDADTLALLCKTMDTYITTVNDFVDTMYFFDDVGRPTSKNVKADLPSALKCQCVCDAKSIFIKFKKGVCETLPILKRPVAIWNNQNYKVEADSISIPLFIDGKTRRVKIKAVIPEKLYDVLSHHKLGSLRISVVNNKFVAQIPYEVVNQVNTDSGIMGVDLGILCPAVCYTDGKVKFIGNGRKNRVMRRRFKTKRKKLGKRKKLNAIRSLKNKEQRIMKDIDHKLSREIVNFALKNKVHTINLEKLSNIRTTRKSRKNNYNIGTWSFYRLTQYITYKATMAGILVNFVNPAYTSQKCPVCGKLNHADNRNYSCGCGYHCHRDIVGAINICAN